MNDRQRLQDLGPILKKRQRLLQIIRAHFSERGFLEVETPVRLPAPASEDFIDAEPAGDWFLRTSPELHMKRLLAAGHPRLYQIGPCFRRGERGRRHQPEFTMLEWYRADADYLNILEDTCELVRSASRQLNGQAVGRFAGREIDLALPWVEMTVDEAFQRLAGRTLADLLRAAPGEFERTLVEEVEPRLPTDRAVILRDYPAPFGGLARRCPERPDRVERWELYLGGLEIANAYSELTDAAEQRQRFLASQELRRRESRTVYPADERFFDALTAGMPPSGGIALGIDRLLMVLADVPDIAGVMAFPNEQV